MNREHVEAILSGDLAAQPRRRSEVCSNEGKKPMRVIRAELAKRHCCRTGDKLLLSRKSVHHAMHARKIGTKASQNHRALANVVCHRLHKDDHGEHLCSHCGHSSWKHFLDTAFDKECCAK